MAASSCAAPVSSSTSSTSLVLPAEIRGALQEDFGFLVVLGSSGSGKTRLCRDLRSRDGRELNRCGGLLEERDPLEWFDQPTNRDKAVISHPDLETDQLSAVGFNKIPSWCRPWRCLSNGEQSRVKLALSVKSGAVLDDFAAVVDPDLAASMAIGLAKLARVSGSRRIVVATTKPEVVTFLQPDFVILASSRELIRRPSASPLRPTITVTAPGMQKFDRDTKRWRGDIDDAKDLDAEAKTLAGRRNLGLGNGGATKQGRLSVKVDDDEKVSKAAGAFDYEFVGRSETDFFAVEGSHPVYQGRVGYIFGPSGSGKTSALKAILKARRATSGAASSSSSGVTSSTAFLKLNIAPRSLQLQVEAGVFDEKSIEQLSPTLSTIERMELDGGGCAASSSMSGDHGDSDLAGKLGLDAVAAARPYRDLSTSEQHRSDVIVLLNKAATASATQPNQGRNKKTVVCIDEFTSSMDRKTAAQFCAQLRRVMDGESRFQSVSLIVAGLFSDVLSALNPSWALNALTGTVSVPSSTQQPLPAVPRGPPTPQRYNDSGISSSSSASSSRYQNRNQLHEPHHLACRGGNVYNQQQDIRQDQESREISGRGAPWSSSASDVDICDPKVVAGLFSEVRVEVKMKRLENYHAGKSAWASTFEKHHYLQGQLISNGHYFLLRVAERQAHPALQCFREGAAIGFLCTSVHVGQGWEYLMVEKRLVVLPEFQGFGIGPKISAVAGEQHLANNFKYNSCTAHPRLGGSRDTFEVEDPETGKRHKLWVPNASNGKASTDAGMGVKLQEKSNAGRKRPINAKQLEKQQRLANQVPRVMFRHHYCGPRLRLYEALDKRYKEFLAEKLKEKRRAIAEAAAKSPEQRQAQRGDDMAQARRLVSDIEARSRQNFPARGPVPLVIAGKRPVGRPPKNGVYKRDGVAVVFAGVEDADHEQRKPRGRPRNGIEDDDAEDGDVGAIIRGVNAGSLERGASGFAGGRQERRVVDRLGDEEFNPFASMNTAGRAPRRVATTNSANIEIDRNACAAENYGVPTLPPLGPGRALSGESNVSSATNSSSSAVQWIESGGREDEDGATAFGQNEDEDQDAAMEEWQRQQRDQSEKHAEAAINISEACGITVEEAIQFLEMYDWDAERAFSAAFEQRQQLEDDMSQLPADPNNPANVHGATTPSGSSAVAASASGAGGSSAALGGSALEMFGGGAFGSSSSSSSRAFPSFNRPAQPNAGHNFLPAFSSSRNCLALDLDADGELVSAEDVVAHNVNDNQEQEVARGGRDGNGPPPGKENIAAARGSALVLDAEDEEEAALLFAGSPDAEPAAKRRRIFGGEYNGRKLRGDDELSENFARRPAADAAPPALARMSEAQQIEYALQLSLASADEALAAGASSSSSINSMQLQAQRQHQQQNQDSNTPWVWEVQGDAERGAESDVVMLGDDGSAGAGGHGDEYDFAAMQEHGLRQEDYAVAVAVGGEDFEDLQPDPAAPGGDRNQQQHANGLPPAAPPAPAPPIAAGEGNDLARALAAEEQETEEKVAQVALICGVSREAAVLALKRAGGVVEVAVAQHFG
mmetsp:Transcript_3513/g.8306  ORF Transcript_3513/g.8306 Transcript_3513/m.8306 type:complete len:1560 (-) Transcript_3513:785-5464(-)|eukprot:CAMPEP_0178986648 /NCGR_PEP_ID=MMETSP0795-20121207/2819_1 /TAXON_ID=88552 /ORGANISM="Amoebophrya sp., Strain Ameob2" /LENGTH=1559 /DNA_ID=CAMNT_0020677729 /DNA_START=70 /DNA_END=4749 /DNA_ORIENTATION=+